MQPCVGSLDRSATIWRIGDALRSVQTNAEDLRVLSADANYSWSDLRERIDKTEREIDEETYKIWTKTLPISKLGEVQLVIAEKVTDDDEDDLVSTLRRIRSTPPLPTSFGAIRTDGESRHSSRTRSRISALETARCVILTVPFVAGTFRC